MKEILGSLLVIVLILALTSVILRVIESEKGKRESSTSQASAAISDAGDDQEASLGGRSYPVQATAGR